MNNLIYKSRSVTRSVVPKSANRKLRGWIKNPSENSIKRQQKQKGLSTSRFKMTSERSWDDLKINKGSVKEEIKIKLNKHIKLIKNELQLFVVLYDLAGLLESTQKAIGRHLYETHNDEQRETPHRYCPRLIPEDQVALTLNNHHEMKYLMLFEKLEQINHRNKCCIMKGVKEISKATTEILHLRRKLLKTDVIKDTLKKARLCT